MASSDFEVLEREFPDGPGVSGFLHAADGDSALVLTHGAGGNADSRLLVALAATLAAQGVSVLRCNMPFRQKRPKGPPHAGSAAKDREGLRRAVECMRERAAKGRRACREHRHEAERQDGAARHLRPGLHTPSPDAFIGH